MFLQTISTNLKPFLRTFPSNFLKQILEDKESIEMMKEALIQGKKPYPLWHRKLKGEENDREIWQKTDQKVKN